MRSTLLVSGLLAALPSLAWAAPPGPPGPGEPAAPAASASTAVTKPAAKPSGSPVPLASDKPVRVDAEEVRFSWKTRQVTVVGRPLVTMQHDDATLSCRKLTGENDAAGKLRQATCEGQVKLVRGDRTVTCDRAVYDRDGATLICTGNPVLRDAGGTEARGTKLTYDLGGDEVRLEGAAQVTVPSGQMDLLQGAGLRTGGRAGKAPATPDPAAAPAPAPAPATPTAPAAPAGLP